MNEKEVLLIAVFFLFVYGWFRLCVEAIYRAYENYLKHGIHDPRIQK